MNAMLTIEVRLLSQQAIEQAKALQESLKSVQNSTAGAGSAASSAGSAFSGAMTNLENFGKNLQWTGRQLTYNFTLPLVIAGGAATKWALDNNAAMANVTKAYGAFDNSAQDTQGELKALATSFELLSDRFGVNQAEVINIAYTWAQAGAAGVALAKATKLTLETMALTGEDASKAADQLLTIQSAYRLNTDQLRTSLEALNAVQVTTAVEFGGLIDAVSRAAGSASAAGIDMDHLAAMTAALVPATGSASAAGNALRTMISRLMAPTKQAADELGLLGINVNDASWQAKDGVQRFEALGQAWTGLSDAQKNLVSSVIASRWQINRFDVLMNDITSSTGVYQKALANTSDTVRAHAQYTQMLATVLGSSSQGFKILTTNIQNALSKAIVPLLPALTGLLAQVLKLVTAFTNLDPNIQQLILTLLVMLALVGPITKYIGAFTTLVGLLGKAFVFVAGFVGELFTVISDGFMAIMSLPMLFIKGIWAMASAVGEAIGGISGFLIGIPEAIATALGVSVSAVVVAIAAVIGLLALIFRRQLGDAIQWVIDAFWLLPRAVTDVFISVIEVIKNAALKIRDWLSYINPFARHSPSLVDNVHRGSAVIRQTYSQMGSHVQDELSNAQAAHQDFQAATDPLSGAKNATKAANIISVLPGSADAVWAMVHAMEALGTATAAAKAEMVAQQAVVDNMKKQIDTDMKPYNDAILMNSVAQKQLRLDIMRAEDAAGGSLDAIKQKMAMAQGQIESLQSEKTSLRLAGAGSDILSGFDTQIGAARSEQDGLRAKADAIQALQDKLDALQRAGEELQLEKDIKFDPQLAALQAQQDKLNDLKDTYQSLNDQLTAMQSNFDQIASAADQAISAAKSAASGPSASLNSTEFGAAGDANFPTVGGDTIPGIGREGGLPEIQDFNQQLQDELQKQLDSLGSFDLFKPIRDGWDTAWAWVAKTIGPYVNPIIKSIRDYFNGIDWSGVWNGLKSISLGDILSPFKGIADWFSKSPISSGIDLIIHVFQTLWEILKSIGSNVLTIFLPVWNFVWNELTKFADAIGGELSKWGPTWGKLVEAVGHIFDALMFYWTYIFNEMSIILKVALFNIMAIWSYVWPYMSNVLQPILDGLISIITAGLEQIRAIVNLVLDLINGDWGAAWNDVLTYVGAVWNQIYAIISMAVGLVLGTIKGTIDGIISFFEFLWDALVGHSIIPDMVNAIVDWFQKLSDLVLAIWNPFWDLIKAAWDNVGQPMFDIISSVITDVIIPGFQLFFDTVGVLWGLFWTGLQAMWDTFGGPIFSVITTIVSGISDLFNLVITSIGVDWGLLWTGLQSVWDTFGVPLFAAVTWIVSAIQGVFDTLLNGVGTVWGVLWTGLKTSWDLIGAPIMEAIIWVVTSLQGPFNDLIGVVSNVWGIITGVITTGVNFFIDAYNLIARGINSVLDFLHLPNIPGGIDHVGGGGGNPNPGTIPTHGAFATGGVVQAMSAAGGVTSNIRAIVGEGSDVYPEYVIPTDPMYRNNALGLIFDLQKKLMLAEGGIVFAAAGDVIGDIPGASQIEDAWNYISDAVNKLSEISGPIYDVGMKIVSFITSWLTDVAQSVVSGTVDTFLAGTPLGPPLEFLGDLGFPGLANGGIVLPRPGGTLVRLGEGSHAEMVQPLRHNGDYGASYNFYGDLSFPNITKPDDAKKFLTNLENVGT